MQTQPDPVLVLKHGELRSGFGLDPVDSRGLISVLLPLKSGFHGSDQRTGSRLWVLDESITSERVVKGQRAAGRSISGPGTLAWPRRVLPSGTAGDDWIGKLDQCIGPINSSRWVTCAWRGSSSSIFFFARVGLESIASCGQGTRRMTVRPVRDSL